MLEKNPEVSVIITTHNRCPLLVRAIKSVLLQTYTDFELIVVDDASMEDPGPVVTDFKDPRIRYIRHKESKGGPAARNTGIKGSKGKYIGFLDDDDEWMPEKLEKEIKKMESSSPRTGLIYSGNEVWDDKDNILEASIPSAKGDLRKRLLRGNITSVSTVLVRKECFDVVGGFDENLASCQDWDMWKRISDHYEFDFVPELLTRIYIHKVQISSDFSSLIPGRTRMIEKHMDEFRKYPDILVIHLKRLGKLHCINGTWKEALYWFREVVKVNIFEIFKIIGWCIFELPGAKLNSRIKKFKLYQKK